MFFSDQKGQYSIEYVAITGISLAFVSMVFVYSMSAVYDSLTIYQAESSVSALSEGMERAATLGPGTRIFVEIDLPNNVINTIQNKGEIGYVISTNSGLTDIYEYVDVNYTGTLPMDNGPRTILVYAQRDGSILIEPEAGSVIWDVFELSDTNVVTPEDTTPPIVNLIYPGDSSVVPAGSIDFQYTPNDSASDINYCMLYIDDAYDQTSYSVANNSTNHFYKSLSQGDYNWYVSCVDDSNNANQGTSSTNSFTVSAPDTTAPSIALSYPGAGASMEEGSIDFNFIPSDTQSLIEYCDLFVDDMNVLRDFSNDVNALNTIAHSLSAGDYNWHIGCADSSPNYNYGTAASRNLTLTVSDTTSPTVSLISPANAATLSAGQISFQFTPSDTESGIDYCDLLIDDSAVTRNSSIDINIPNTINWTLTVGDYNWRVECVDDSSNANLGTSGYRTLAIELGVTIIAFDTFPTTSWNGGSGWLADWTNTGDSAIDSTSPHSSPYHVRLRRGTGYIKRSVNLSSYSSPRLEFWAKAESFEGSENATALISHNNTNWTVIETWADGDDDGIYRKYAYDLNAYTLSAEFWVAFQANMGNPQDRFYVDDLNIVEGYY